jgi:hypothetical protein
LEPLLAFPVKSLESQASVAKSTGVWGVVELAARLVERPGRAVPLELLMSLPAQVPVEP